MSKEYFREPQNYDDQCVDGAYEGFGIASEITILRINENTSPNGFTKKDPVTRAQSSVADAMENFSPILDNARQDLRGEQDSMDLIRLDTEGYMIFCASNTSLEE